MDTSHKMAGVPETSLKITFYMLKASNIYFLLILIFSFSCSHEKNPKFITGKNWPIYLGDNQNSHYSPLNQIDKSNVNQLKVAWEYKTGDADAKGNSQIQCNPIIIDGILFGSTPMLKVFALDAASGKEIWRFDPASVTDFSLHVSRGLVYWEDGDDKRIFFTAGPYLFALNAETGYPIQTFGIFGRASLKSKLGEWAQNLYVVSRTPGIIFKDLLIMGTALSEGALAAPGYIRAYDVRTGKVRWTFRTVPKPGEFGYETWPKEAYQSVGGANSWCGFAMDEEREIVFVPTGSASYDFFGGNRKAQPNHFRYNDLGFRFFYRFNILFYQLNFRVSSNCKGYEVIEA